MPAMGLFGSSRPRRVVKTYGVDTLFGMVNPMLTMMMVSLGLWRRRGPEEHLHEMERDAQEMVNRGYRIVSTQDYELPQLGISYQKVTYEREDHAA